MRKDSTREREGERARERGKRWTRTSHRLKRMGQKSIFVKHSHVIIRRPLLEIPKYARWISGSFLSLQIGHCFGREACVTLGSDCTSVEEMLMRSPQSFEGVVSSVILFRAGAWGCVKYCGRVQVHSVQIQFWRAPL